MIKKVTLDWERAYGKAYRIDALHRRLDLEDRLVHDLG